MADVGDAACLANAKGGERDYMFAAMVVFAVIGVLETVKAVCAVVAKVFVWATTKQQHPQVWVSPCGSKYHSSTSCKGLSATTGTAKTACALCWK